MPPSNLVNGCYMKQSPVGLLFANGTQYCYLFLLRFRILSLFGLLFSNCATDCFSCFLFLCLVSTDCLAVSLLEPCTSLLWGSAPTSTPISICTLFTTSSHVTASSSLTFSVSSPVSRTAPAFESSFPCAVPLAARHSTIHELQRSSNRNKTKNLQFTKHLKKDP